MDIEDKTAEKFGIEIHNADKKRSPCIHGLLEVLALRIFNSQNGGCWGKVVDWHHAVSLLVNYMTSLPDDYCRGITSFEEYLRREISFEASDISKGYSNRDQYQNWMTAVNNTADCVMNCVGRHYLTQSAAA